MARPLGRYPFHHDLESGIYQITNAVTGAKYIGSAVQFYRRWRKHYTELCNGTHHCSHLQRAWNKYGDTAFVWDILEYAPVDMLIEREQFWLNQLFCGEESLRYNLTPTAGSNLGVKRSEETKKKMSDKAKLRGDNGLQRDEEWRRKVSEANRKNAKSRCDQEMRDKVSQLKKGNAYVKGRVWAHTPEGVNFRVPPDDPRLQSGELTLGRG